MMRTAIALLVVLFAVGLCPANPSGMDPTLFFDFDEDGYPDGDVHFSIHPASYVTVDAYIALSCIDEPGEEFTVASFALANPL